MSDNPIVTRFAPSPTGALHVGGARTALFNWAFARRHGGRFILRIEDTDQARSTPQSTQGLIRDLRWLGIDWDEGPPCPNDWLDAIRVPFDPQSNQIGDKGPYFQSQRLDVYGAHVDQLLESGRAYVPADETQIVRFRMDDDVGFDDAVYGRINVKAKELEDFVIRKSDGYPTFHLAVVVDDALMAVTHVIRGQEHLTNTAKHVALQDALGLARPVYAHTPSIMNPDGSKMSKRDKIKAARRAAQSARRELVEKVITRHEQIRTLATPGSSSELQEERIVQFLDKKTDDDDIASLIADVLRIELPEIDVSDFRDSGYLAHVLCNYIALLGWSPGNDVERFGPDPLEFLKNHFELSRSGKANAKFDREKLSRFNAETIAALSPPHYLELLDKHRSFYHPGFMDQDRERFRLFANAYQKRSPTLETPFRIGRFFAGPVSYDEKAVDKVLLRNDRQGFTLLEDIREQLKTLENWSPAAIQECIERFSQEQGVEMGKIAQPLRVAVSGSTVSPPIDQTLAILDRDDAIDRIDRCRGEAARLASAGDPRDKSK